MPRHAGTTPPAYRRHRASGQAIVTISLPDGSRTDHYLGDHGSPASKRLYAKLCREWKKAWDHHRKAKAGEPIIPTPALPIPDGELSVAELVLRFYAHVENYYRKPDGTPTSEATEFRYPLRVLRQHFGEMGVNAFSPLSLKEAQEHMIDLGWSRKLINRRIGRIRQCFRWGVSEELVRADTLFALQSVPALKEGRSRAKERPKIQPVDPGLVKRTLPFLTGHLQALVKVLLYCGARCGEICVMRPQDLDQRGPVWIYTPAGHKTAHHGHTRRIALGKRCQKALLPFLDGIPPEAYVFSPVRSVEAWRAMQRAKRRTPLSPSQAARKPKKNPKRAKGEKYTPSAVAHAVKRACDAGLLPRWHPHQLRHTFGRRVRKRFGLDHAQAALGHKTAALTDHYSEIEQRKILTVGEALG